MTRTAIALLLSAIPVALAYPKHLGFGHAAVHARGGGHKYQSDSSTGPYGEYNTTSRGPTGSGTGSLVTVTVSPLPLSSSAAAPQSAESTTTTCTSLTVTTTTTNRVTVTVQPSSTGAPKSVSSSSSSSSSTSASSIASSSSAAAPVVSTVYSSSSASSAISSSLASSSSSSLIAYTSSAVSTSATYVPSSSASSTLVTSSTSTPAVSSTTASTSTSVVAPNTVVSSSSATATPSSYSSASSAGTKRGLAYASASLTSAFTAAPISWAYNWAATTSGLPSQFEFIPMLWGLGDHTQGWSQAASSAVSSGSGHLLGFNEPDETLNNGGCDLSPADAVTGWNTNMQPFAGGATKLGSPAVTNGGAPMGLTWLGEFMQQCSGCQIDFLNVHWYCGTGDSVASAVADFKDHVGKAITQGNGKPVWVTEFRYIGSGSETDFINQILPWLDATDGVGRYSYYMATNNLLLSGTGLSATGEAYVSA